MTTLQDRETAFENKYAHDQEVKFRVEAKAGKLMGIWAAGQLGLTDTDAVDYRNSLLNEKFSNLAKKIGEDFAAKNIGVSQRQVDAILLQKLDEAAQMQETE